jgi:hypothetical protein
MTNHPLRATTTAAHPTEAASGVPGQRHPGNEDREGCRLHSLPPVLMTVDGLVSKDREGLHAYSHGLKQGLGGR